MNELVKDTVARANYSDVARDMCEMANEKLFDEHRYRSLDILVPYANNGEIIKSLGQMCRGSHTIEEPRVDFLMDEVEMREQIKRDYSEEKVSELEDIQGKYAPKYSWETKEYNFASKEAEQKHKDATAELESIRSLGHVHCVGDDFLSFKTFKEYELIMMTPPVTLGAEYTLKAIERQKKTGGKVISFLASDLILNPETDAEKSLVEQLCDLNAEVRCVVLNDTEVNSAIVYCEIEKSVMKSRILAEVQNRDPENENVAVLGDENYIATMMEQYAVEVEATLKLVDEYKAMEPYIMDKIEIPGEEHYMAPLIDIGLLYGGAGRDDFSTNDYLRRVRLKYWNWYFYNPQITGALTSNLRDEFYDMIGRMGDYDFNAFNIGEIEKMMAEKLEQSYYDTILSLFDKLSNVHAYSGEPEEQNVHYYNGWKTNKAWKINDKKVIIPCYGAFRNYSWDKGFDPYSAYKVLADIEQTLNYIDNGRTEEPMFSLTQILDCMRGADAVRNLDTKYFKVTFYKKGTCHIAWKDKKLVEKLNIFGSQRKAWLPPAYGVKKYEDMSEEEKNVIDEFQGEKAYKKVLAEKEFYLNNTSEVFQIEGGETA